MNAKTKGYILGAVAAATYGMNPLFALPLYENGMDTDSVLLFRYLFALPLLGIMLKARGRDFRLQRREILPLIVLGLLVAVSSLTLFQSYHYMDAGIASTLLFVYPILVALIMAVAFKEKVTLQTALCILLALCGIGLLYRNGDGSTLNLTGTIMVFASALSYALYIVGINRTVLKNVATLKVTFYILLSGLTLFFGPSGFRRTHNRPGPMVLVGKSARSGDLPDGHLVLMYDRRHSIHRIDPDSHSRGAGARHGRLFRSRRLRRTADAAESAAA